MQCLATLVGAPSAACTALAWYPTGIIGLNSPLLASGDVEGRVIVWDVLSSKPAAVLDNASKLLFKGSRSGAKASEAMESTVNSLAWITSWNYLAILSESGFFTIWDPSSTYMQNEKTRLMIQFDNHAYLAVTHVFFYVT